MFRQQKNGRCLNLQNQKTKVLQHPRARIYFYYYYYYFYSFFFLLLNRFHCIIENDFLSACTLKHRKTKLSLTFSSSFFFFFLSFFQSRHYNWRRRQCDKAFKHDMKRVCKKFGWFKRWWCKKFANLYYRSVRVGGFLFFKSPPQPWCKKTCAKNRGDPNKPLWG